MYSTRIKEIIMRKIIIIAVTVLFAVTLYASAFGDDRGRGHRGGAPGQERDISAIPGLELSNEQVLRIKALREDHLKDVKPLVDKMGAQRKELKELWLMTPPNREKIASLQKDIRKLRDIMQDKMFDYRNAVFAILTPEQKKKLEAAVKQRRLHPGPRWGMKRQDSQGTPR